jgi:hypothetical protein
LRLYLRTKTSGYCLFYFIQVNINKYPSNVFFIMRLVQVLIPNGKRDSVLKALDDEEIDYAVWDETGRGDFEALVEFPIPPVGVEPVLDKLRKAGVGEDTYTIVLSPEIVISKRIDNLKKRYPDQRISREELVTRAQDLAPPASTYIAFLVLSTAIATA